MEEVVPQYFKDFAYEMNRRFDHVDEKIDGLASALHRHEETLDEHTMMLRAMTGRHDQYEERISSLERTVTRLRLKIDHQTKRAPTGALFVCDYCQAARIAPFTRSTTK